MYTRGGRVGVSSLCFPKNTHKTVFATGFPTTNTHLNFLPKCPRQSMNQLLSCVLPSFMLHGSNSSSVVLYLLDNVKLHGSNSPSEVLCLLDNVKLHRLASLPDEALFIYWGYHRKLYTLGVKKKKKKNSTIL